MVERILVTLDPFIKARTDAETTPSITFAELYAHLDNEENAFLKKFEAIDLAELNIKIPYRGMVDPPKDLVAIKDQRMVVKGENKKLPTQFLPKKVYDKYLELNATMKKDLGKGLYVESGYRSAAYQLYLLLFYMKNHDYSLKETVKYVAWPGYSEHGSPEHQAIDFINGEGINGEYNTKEFEDLPEYAWLTLNASKFGFVLSYPKNTDMTYEPWHWRYEGVTNSR
ncbi:MAG: D-alanyl-D-alanine carboxypeptidase family protein [Candidatus Omnitrophica bacterium]|nr:D-alanyl-D-alanine carboxypeptidase family protein [Candidatus Omnitrophota bacterium]